MISGTVKWYDPEREFGFLIPDDGGSDIFVHRRTVENAGMVSLQKGMAVTFELHTDPRKPGRVSATKLRLV